MMPQSRGAGGGNRPLKRARAGNVERLRPADAIRSAAAKAGQPGQILAILDFAVAIHDHHRVSAGIADADVPCRTAQKPRIRIKTRHSHIARRTAHQFRRAVGRLPIDHENFEPLGIVVFCEPVASVPLDEPRLVPDGHDDGDEEEGHAGAIGVTGFDSGG